MVPSVPDWGSGISQYGDLVVGAATDFSLYLIIAALVAAFAYVMGRDKLLPLIAALYAGTVLYTTAPLDGIDLGPLPLLTLYGLLVACAFIAFMQLGAFTMLSMISNVRVVGISLITAGFITALLIASPPFRELYAVSPQTLLIFEPPLQQWGWLGAPLLAAFLLAK